MKKIEQEACETTVSGNEGVRNEKEGNHINVENADRVNSVENLAGYVTVNIAQIWMRF